MKRRIKTFSKYIWTKFFINNKKIERGIQNLLLVFPSGIGNAILANGAIKSLKKTYSNAYITAIYMQESTGEILSILGGFKNIIYFGEDFTLKEKVRFVSLIKKEKFDVAIVFFRIYDNKLNFLLFITGIPIRIGFEFPTCDSNIFLTHSVRYDFKKTEFQNNLSLLKYFNIPLDYSVAFRVRQDYSIKVNNNKLKVGIHIGPFNEKKPGWPCEKFADLIFLIKRRYDSDIFIFGGREEFSNAIYFNQKFGNKIRNLIETANLEQSIYYISLMNLFISNDTALMHIAASQKVPLIAIFGPTDQVKNFPIVQDEKKLKIISKNLPCQPCYAYGPHCKLNDCVNKIMVDEVMNNADEMIRAGSL